MILKTRDANPEALRRLERDASLELDPVRSAALRGRISRLRADSTSADACALIDDHFAATGEWAVLHDLCLSEGTRTVHLNHLLVSDRLECVCIDSRYLRHGLEADDRGVVRAYSAHGASVIASPLTKAARDVRMLGVLLNEANLLPRRFGIGPRGTVRGIVLTDPSLRIGLFPEGGRDTVGVFASDALFAMLWRGNRATRPLDRVSRETLVHTCERIASLHRPTVPEALLRAA